LRVIFLKIILNSLDSLLVILDLVGDVVAGATLLEK